MEVAKALIGTAVACMVLRSPFGVFVCVVVGLTLAGLELMSR